MKILFCSHAPISKKLGASKTLIELAEELEKLDWTCKIIGPSDLADDRGNKYLSPDRYAEKLKQYLQQHASDYDVIDYDCGRLPYSRKEFCNKTLFVARCQLLGYHWRNIKIPNPPSWKRKISELFFARIETQKSEHRIEIVEKTCKESDLIIVFNYADKEELVKNGFSENKIRVLPGGMSLKQRQLFEAEVLTEPPLKPKLAFVGTFDNRKGATDFSKILQTVSEKFSELSFRLLGTSCSEDKILPKFPQFLRNKIEVIPTYNPEELPRLLSPCSVGIFPSYIEGFGFGVLEMLAASIPVIAYDSPGPPMMLPPEYLVSPGDTKGMSDKVISLLGNKAKLTEARLWAKQQSQLFCWQKIARETSEVYLEYWKKRQAIIKL